MIVSGANCHFSNKRICASGSYHTSFPHLSMGDFQVGFSGSCSITCLICQILLKMEPYKFRKVPFI